MHSADPAQWPEFSLLTEITTLPSESGYRIWQRKSDGFRVYANTDRLVFRGRAAHRHELVIGDSAIPAGWLLDGELVVPGGDINDVPTMLATKRWDRLRFEAFDLIEADGVDVRAQPYRERWARLCERFGTENLVAVHAEPHSVIPPVPTAWEGVVGKLMEAPWQPGRTTAAVKWKRSAVLAAQIVGFNPGSGSWANTVGAVRFGLQNAEGQLVEVGTAGGLKSSDRRRFAADPAAYVGHDCVIKHYGLLKRKLRNPIFIGLSNKEDNV